MNLTDTLNLAWAAFEREEYVGSERTFRDLLAMPALTISERQQARFGLGYALAFLQQFEEARNLFDPLRPEARAGGDPGAEHRALHQVGMVERLAGNWGAAQDCFERERDLIAHLGNGDLAVAINAYELGLTSLKLGQTEQAKSWPDLSLNRAERTDDLIAVGCAHRAWATGTSGRASRRRRGPAGERPAPRFWRLEMKRPRPMSNAAFIPILSEPWSRPAAPIQARSRPDCRARPRRPGSCRGSGCRAA
ncbi:tetratricopeptide repeat protein [Deinococcus sp.]|uniref:tetratricopeptide repeat protein n=1 Tax=Deinococcus sp. TaxID=47478 RepID=UPI003C7A3629